METAQEQTAAGEAPATPAPASPPKAAPHTFADMRMKVGDRAQLEPPSQMNAGRVPVRIVGWVEGRSLIVTVPMTNSGRLALQKGENVLLRVFTGSSAFAFKGTVLKAPRPPFDYLHLTFPDKVEGLEVRSSPRYRVNIEARAVPAGGAGAVDARIDNISATGAMIESAEPLGSAGEEIKLDFDFSLHGVPSALKLTATIRTAKSAEDAAGAPRHQHGVTFKDPPPHDLLLLRALVWYEMHEHPRNAV